MTLHCANSKTSASTTSTRPFVPLTHFREYEIIVSLEDIMKNLSIPERHQLRIARDTMRMTPAMARIMGGPSVDEAIEIIRRLTAKEVK